MREGTDVYLWLIHVDVWQKQYNIVITLQLKINKKFLKLHRKKNNNTDSKKPTSLAQASHLITEIKGKSCLSA